MKKFFIAALTCLITAGLSACSNQNLQKDMSQAEGSAQTQTAAHSSVMKYLNDDTRLVPTKIFDNLYCIGSVSVVCYVLKTSDGLILIDSMWDDNDAKFIEQSLAALKLDPRDLKYIYLTHGHGDHYGGASYLAQKYNAKVLMSKTDEEFMLSTNFGANGPRSPKPKIDVYIDDDYKLTLGDTTLTILATPGHTPGCTSALFEAKDGASSYKTVLWGGTGIPKDPHWQKEYLKSALYFKDVALKNKAKVLLTAHLFANDGFAMLDAVNEGKSNPFIRTSENMDQLLDGIISSVKAKLAQN